MTDTCPLDDPLDAVTHADPYPYYAALRARAPLDWNARQDLWVASDSASVDALLAASAARVRPLDEPVPRWLVGSVAGEFFGSLVRMNDGAQHARLREYVRGRLERIETLACETKTEVWAHGLDDFAECFPVRYLGVALGIASSRLDHLVEAVRALASAFAPGASLEAVRRGSEGADALIEMCASRRAQRVEAINDAGLFIQNYDATRGLIANTLVALARDPEALDAARRDRSAVVSIVEQTSRYDSPVQNTRRFLAEDFATGGTRIPKGDAVLLLLASANWDSAATHSYTFGSGAHACVGTRLATAIAAAGVGAVLDSCVDVARSCHPTSYKPSPNARIALFGTP